MDCREKTACLTFVAFLKSFLGNKKVEKLADLVVRMLKALCDLGCEMSIRLHFISSYLDQIATYKMKFYTLNSHLDQETGQDDCLKESGSTKILRKWMIVTKDVWKNT